MEDEEQGISADDVLEVIELPEQAANGVDAKDEDSGDSDVELDLEGGAAAANSATLDMALVTFSKHTGDVFSVDTSPIYAASGGEDDRAYVWKLDNGDVVFECTGHSDSITYVRFNARKSLLATGDMAGLIQVWRMENFTQLTQFQVGDLSWLRWHHTADILFCGDEDGSVWMYLVPNGDCKVYAGYGSPCTVGELFPDGKRLCAGYSDGGVRIWDLKTSTFINVEGGAVHKSPVTSIDVSHDNTLIASGAEDGTVNLIHAVSGKIVTSFVCAKRNSSSQSEQQQGDNSEQSEEMETSEDLISVESVAFSKTLPALFTGTVNGEIAIWDLNSHVVRQTISTQEGIVKATWIDQYILVVDLGGTLRLYDGRNGEIVTQWTGHQSAVLDFNLSADGQILVSSSSDHTCKVFRTNQR